MSSCFEPADAAVFYQLLGERAIYEGFIFDVG